MDAQLAAFISQTLKSLIAIAGVACVFFLIRAGYLYITSSGNPEQLHLAKQGIKQTLIGLLIVLSASTLVGLATHSWQSSTPQANPQPVQLKPVEQTDTSGSFSQIMTEAIIGFIKTLIESSLKPLVDGVFQFLTTTPSMASNSTIFHFWVVMAGIANGLLVLMVALLGLHVMSSSALGLEEVDIHRLFPILLAVFIGANSSIFLIDWLITAANTFVKALLAINGGANQTWMAQALDPVNLLSSGTNLFTLLLLLLLLLLVAALLVLYVGRLITISFGAAISPLVFLLLAHPKTQNFAMNLMKSYIITVTIVAIHVLILEVSSSLLTDAASGKNALMDVLLGIGIMLTLLKSSSFLLKIVLLAGSANVVNAIGGQMMNVLSQRRSI